MAQRQQQQLDTHTELKVKEAQEKLKSEDWQVRLQTIQGLAALPGEAKRRLVEAVARVASADGDREVRAAACVFLENLPTDIQRRAAAHLAEQLQDENRHVKAFAAEAMGVLGPACGAQADVLVKLLKDKNSVVRRAVAYAIGRLEDAGVQHAEALADALRDHESEVRRGAVRGLGSLGTAAEPYLEQMVELLRDVSYCVRRDTATALAAVGGPRAIKAAAEELVARALEDDHVEVRKSAGAALAALRKGGGLCSKQLAAALGDDSPQTRLRAAEALAPHGAGAGPCAEQVSGALDDEESEVRWATTDVFAAMDAESGAPFAEPLVDLMLREQDMDIQFAAARALAVVGAAALSQVDRLLSALADEQMSMRLGGALGLRALAAHAAPHAEAAAGLLVDDSWFVRRAAAQALGLMGAAAAPHAEQLLKMSLHDIDDDVRRASIEAFAAQGDVAAKHVDEIAKLTKDKKRVVRCAAALALGTFGKASTPHFQNLRDLLREGDPRLRKAAAEGYSRLPKGVAQRDDVEMVEDLERRDTSEAVRFFLSAALKAWGKK